MIKLSTRANTTSFLLRDGIDVKNESVADTIDELMETQRILSEALSKIADKTFGIRDDECAQEALKKAGLR